MNLHKGARPDERFHLQSGQPRILKVVKHWWGRTVNWTNIYLEDGTPGHWCSRWIWNLQIYSGNVKCDATRTSMYWNHQLDNNSHDPDKYVMTTTPSEMSAFRWRSHGPKPFVNAGAWNDMGGI